jgi:glycosyltransferase involved in cell wall biosynthesis
LQIAILALGMAEKNDSVTNDAAYQFKLLSSANSSVDTVRIFANTYDPACFPEIPVEPVSAFYNWLETDSSVIVVFHYCDSRTPYDEFLRMRCRNLIIRWHNATPPWFTFGLQNQSANHALLGYENIIDFINCGDVWFWGNSNFTRDQLVALGAPAERCRVVYPASRYLDRPAPPFHGSGAERTPKHALDLLFVSRIVAHKGHANAILLADRVQELTGKPVRLNIVGKGLDDPNALSSSLLRAIQNAKAEIVIHGLVSDERLVELYRGSDVFVCLSEHEGFGLPVFEAMRYRLPVVAWATTSFRELLARHPFAFPHFDLDLFACAVASLAQPGVRERLLELQYAILLGYNSDILRLQIKTALAAFQTMWGQPMTDDLARDAIRFNPHIASVIDINRQELQKIYKKSFDDGVIFDSHANLMSLHDLRMFKAFVKQKTELIKALTAPALKPAVKFRSDEFSMRKGVTLADAPGTQDEANITSFKSGHLVYGPYVQMPSGQYDASFDVAIDVAQPHAAEFEIDVNSGNLKLASVKFALSHGKHKLDDKTLSFALAGKQPLVELRLRSIKDFKGRVVFDGATLVKTDVIPRRMSQVPRPAARNKMLAYVRSLFGKTPQRVQAKMLFRRGNVERNAKFWKDAAYFYDLGLRLDPDNFAYIVQSAHMHKEAGDFEEARALYEKAYSLNPSDADLCLQMGHFFKISGNRQAAVEFYHKAVSSHGSIAGDAGGELAALVRL